MIRLDVSYLHDYLQFGQVTFINGHSFKDEKTNCIWVINPMATIGWFFTMTHVVQNILAALHK